MPPMTTLRTQSSMTEPPPWFTDLIRDALNHLNDPAHLLGHQLNQVLADLIPEGADPGQGLRELLLDAVDEMEPPRGSTVTGLDRRPYLSLTYRFVDGFSTQDVARRLHVGARQCRRDLFRAVQALSILLWDRRCKAANANPESEIGPQHRDAIVNEVATLGVELERIPLADILQALEASAMALAERYAVSLQLCPDRHSTDAFCDRTLTKGALISCLSAVLQATAGSTDRALTIRPAVVDNLPGLQMLISPSITPAQAVSLEADLVECRTLLSAQGGNVRLLPDESGCCSGVWIALGAQGETRILVVDDNEGMRQLYERYLSPRGLLLRLAASVAEAEAILDCFSPDVIILDVMMRETDGWEFLQALRTRPTARRVPVIVCSVLREPGLAAALGAQAYLKKPITAEGLLDALARVLGWSSQGGRPPEQR
jgi:CheY-like chemotaxis protein